MESQFAVKLKLLTTRLIVDYTTALSKEHALNYDKIIDCMWREGTGNQATPTAPPLTFFARKDKHGNSLITIDNENFAIRREDRTVTGCEVNGEVIPLTAKQITKIRGMHISCEEKR